MTMVVEGYEWEASSLLFAKQLARGATAMEAAPRKKEHARVHVEGLLLVHEMALDAVLKSWMTTVVEGYEWEASSMFAKQLARGATAAMEAAPWKKEQARVHVEGLLLVHEMAYLRELVLLVRPRHFHFWHDTAARSQ
jgi:hypothetical protein